MYWSIFFFFLVNSLESGYRTETHDLALSYICIGHTLTIVKHQYDNERKMENMCIFIELCLHTYISICAFSVYISRFS